MSVIRSGRICPNVDDDGAVALLDLPHAMLAELGVD